MNIQSIRTAIENLDIDYIDPASEDNLATAVDVNALPKGIVTGSSLIEFTDSVSIELRSPVALSLLAAQRVASNAGRDNPEAWMQAHNETLQSLSWLLEQDSRLTSNFDSINVAVHKAIIPFLTAALGPAAAASSLIVTALNQLSEMDKDKDWITLFDKQSQRFEVNEFHFGIVEAVGDQTRLRMATARFDASYGRTQVLFFTVTNSDADFEAHNMSFVANSDLLKEMNPELRTRLRSHARRFIREMDLGD